MQTPIFSELLTVTTGDNAAACEQILPVAGRSLESQLKLRSLYQSLDFCRQELDEIQNDLVSYELQRASERLERICVEADSWGFNSMYEIALGLQLLLMNAGGGIPTGGFRDAVQRGLSMLSALLEQCERDFCWRLATADALECISLASGD